MTDKQRKIFEFTQINDQITKAKAIELIGSGYYCNAAKHVGDVLSRMVKSGLLKRLKPGVFTLGEKTNRNPIPENQLDLFK